MDTLPISIPKKKGLLVEKRVCKFKLYDGAERRVTETHLSKCGDKTLGKYIGVNRRKRWTDRRKNNEV